MLPTIKDQPGEKPRSPILMRRTYIQCCGSSKVRSSPIQTRPCAMHAKCQGDDDHDVASPLTPYSPHRRHTLAPSPHRMALYCLGGHRLFSSASLAPHPSSADVMVDGQPIRRGSGRGRGCGHGAWRARGACGCGWP
jgi:hypothetical protein